MSAKGERNEQRKWVTIEPDAGISGTARWDLLDAQANPRVKKELVVPVFVELLPKAARDLTGFIDFLARATDQYSVPEHTMDRLQTEAESPREGGLPMLLIFLSRPDSVENAFWTLLAVGSPQARTFHRDGFARGTPLRPKTGRMSKTPVVGIIDDSIGFLNHRFRRTNGTTRFRSLWIMHNDTLAGDPGPCIPLPFSGIELTEAHINTRLAWNRSEESLYRQVNSGIFSPASRHGTAFHTGHGTHVLDLAAGAGPGEPMSDVPILGVQISPSSIGETSGAVLNPDIVRGLDWVILRALQMPGRFPLIINISLGALAGPMDGTSWIEKQIAAAIQWYHHYSGHAPIRVVIAYGNAHRSRLVAESTLAPGEETSVLWRVLPDDSTRSTLELRTTAGTGAQLTFELVPPDKGSTLSLMAWPTGTAILQYVTPSGVAAEVSADSEHDLTNTIVRDKTTIIAAPTIRSDPRPVSCSGPWTVTVRNTGSTPAWLSLRVQRDDTPGGFRRNGRQSWLDHPEGWHWDDLIRAYTKPGPAGPVTRTGTEVSYAGLQHPSVFFVGAARPDLYVDGTVRPSIYTAEGAMPPPDSPTLSGMGDQGSALTGQRAIGVLTGATARLSGTSVATPYITRQLLDYAMTGAMTAQPASGSPHDLAELAFVLRGPPAAVADARLGFGTVALA